MNDYYIMLTETFKKKKFILDVYVISNAFLSPTIKKIK